MLSRVDELGLSSRMGVIGRVVTPLPFGAGCRRAGLKVIAGLWHARERRLQPAIAVLKHTAPRAVDVFGKREEGSLLHRREMMSLCSVLQFHHQTK